MKESVLMLHFNRNLLTLESTRGQFHQKVETEERNDFLRLKRRDLKQNNCANQVNGFIQRQLVKWFSFVLMSLSLIK